jgi:hypothetical protein
MVSVTKEKRFYKKWHLSAHGKQLLAIEAEQLVVNPK